MGGTSPARVKAGRFFFSQHRRRAVEPDAAPRDRHDVARVFRSAKHDSLDQIHRDRRNMEKPTPCGPDLSALPRSREADAKRRVRVEGGIKTFGHFKPINSPRFLNDCHEYVFHFTKSGRVELNRLALGVPYQDKSNIARWSHTGGKDLRCRGNTWFVPYETIQSREKERPHPATFPVQLAEWCIKLHGVSRVRYDARSFSRHR